MIRGLELSAPLPISGEGRWLEIDQVQSPRANDLIDRAYVMKPP